jgi:hypothetical protein
MDRGRLHAAVVVSVLAIGIAGAGPARAGDASGAGMRAYVDPATGKLTDQPPPGQPPQAIPAAQSKSSAGLVETHAPGGGEMIHLQGRFQSPLVATVGADGTLHVGHADGHE